MKLATRTGWLVLALLALGFLGSNCKRDGAGGDCEDRRQTGGACSDVVTSSEFPPSTVELFDSHGHVMPTWNDEIVPTALSSADLTGYVVLGLDNTLALQKKDSTTYVNCAFVDPGDEDFDGLVEVLDSGARCIGELSVDHFAAGTSGQAKCYDPTSNFLQNVFEEARQRAIPINIHFDYSEDTIATFKSALDSASSTTFIWAHMGDASSTEVRSMLEDHPNLHVDISSRNSVCDYSPRLVSVEDQRLDDGTLKLKDGWKSLFEDYADRVLFGTDIGPGKRHTKIKAVVSYYRTILGQLTLEAQQKIGHENGRTLFGM